MSQLSIISIDRFESLDHFAMSLLSIMIQFNFKLPSLFFIITQVSLFFKLALAPFHMWSPDIYENSPTSSAFFFAIVPKISIFIVILRFSSSVFISISGFSGAS